MQPILQGSGLCFNVHRNPTGMPGNMRTSISTNLQVIWFNTFGVNPRNLRLDDPDEGKIRVL